MTDQTMAEISKGVWVPRGLSRRPAGCVMNPEDEEGDESAAGVCWPPSLAPAPAGDDGYYSAHRAAAHGAAEEERRPRPLEPVAAVTYEQARKIGDATRAAAAAKAAKQDAAMEKAFKNNPDARESYSEAEWNEVPDTESPEPFLSAWYSCVKRYRFIQYGGPLAGGPKLIIEVVLMGDTLLRFILKLSQVKGVLTKSNVRDTHGYERIEEVIIDQRHPHSGYAPEQLKLKFAGAASALAFQMDLMSVL